MSNGFEALAPLADKLKTQARRQEAEREAKQKASEHIARETNVFLDVMNQTGVKAMAGVRIKPRIEEKDIDFAAAMKKAGVKPLGDETRAQHRKVRRPIPVQTIADNKRVLEESMSDDLDSIEFLESEDGKSFRRPGIGPDVPRDLRRGLVGARPNRSARHDGRRCTQRRCGISEKRPQAGTLLRAHHSRQRQRDARSHRRAARGGAPLAQAARRSGGVLRTAGN